MNDIKITVAPLASTATEQGRQSVWPYGYPCGCNLEDGLCATHRPMMARIYAVWNTRETPASTIRAIWLAQDGYGDPGALPEQGYDWSGIRDSTPRAIERMFAVVS